VGARLKLLLRAEPVAARVEGHLPVPGSVVQHRRGQQPWRVESVSEDGAVLSNLSGEVVRLPLGVLVPDRVGRPSPHTGGGGP